jgi:beta-barrel assembly-enhancing protease
MQAPRLENRLPEEGINTSNEHPLREFAWLITAGLVSFGLLLALLSWSASWLAPKIPFRYEQALAQQLKLGDIKPGHEAQQQYLQALVSRITPAMDLPAGMTIHVRYDPAAQVNAYATLGGHVVVFAGLLNQLPSEAALVTLLSHEIAHVKYRHVAASAGRGAAIALALSMLSADAGGRAAQSVFGLASEAALMSYSRDQEQQADAQALATAVALYGHGAGYVELFETLQKEEAKLPEVMRSAGFMRSHPLTQERLQAARELAQRQAWAMTGTSPPLPAHLKSDTQKKPRVEKP